MVVFMEVVFTEVVSMGAMVEALDGVEVSAVAFIVRSIDEVVSVSVSDCLLLIRGLIMEVRYY